MNKSAQIVNKTKSSVPKEDDIGNHSSDKKAIVGVNKRQSQFHYLDFYNDETSSYVLGYN